MRLSPLYSILTSCSAILALSKGDSEWRYWNTTIAKPTTASTGPLPVTDSSALEFAATVQIQIGALFGSGVISFGDISAGGVNAVSTLTSTISSEPCQTDIPATSSRKTSSTYANTTHPFPTRPPLHFNTTFGPVTSQSSGIRASTTSPAELGLVTGSGIQIDRRMPSLLAILSAFVISLL